MDKITKCATLFMALSALTLTTTSCGDDDDSTPITTSIQKTAEQLRDSALSVVNANYVQNTVIATYKKLADDCEELLDMAEDLQSQAQLEQLCNQWKVARQDWELSESFLFGAASGYGIDPHIDTWPFAEASFINLMSKHNPASSEADAEVVTHTIATSQNFTGFHALEYVIFRNGQTRQLTDITADEMFFIKAVAADLYLSACRLEVAWAGDAAQQKRIALLEEEELTPEDNFGREFTDAGKPGSRWKSALEASVQIIEGCIDIVGEVADSKIASAYTGDDVTYIESPHAYNSVQDFYDNIRGVKQALYGGLSTIDATTPAPKSLMSYCLTACPNEANATMAALDNALATISKMKKPFVLNYTDATAGNAIEALHQLDDKLGALKAKLDPDSDK